MLSAALVVAVALVGPVAQGLIAAAAAVARQGGVTGAEAELSAAQAAYDDATAQREAAGAALREAQARAVELETGLRELDARERELVLEFEAALSLAQQLAIDAYVQGGQSAELHQYLDAAEATEAALKRHLSLGRVDRARDAAEVLRTKRASVEGAVASKAVEVAAAVEALAIADREVTQADQALDAAYTRLVAAEQAAADARAEAERIAAERAAAEAAAAARTTAPAPTTARRPPTTTPPPEYRDGNDAWAKLRDCESGGNYRAVSPGGLYRGAYQFDQDTWESVGGTGDPAAASPEEQDLRARLLYEMRGSGPWPLCGRYLP